jgi:hypothetical protein
VFVDSAGARRIEEGAPASWVGLAAQEQVGMVVSNVPRFDLEYAEIVYTALMASGSALQTCRVDGNEWPDPLVHLPIDTVELTGQSFGVHLPSLMDEVFSR